ncbi:MAG: hypothetical protein IJA32_06975 [Lachnospiraceae bacterium]|nr:hypothetical protein [Lachnospiraceae bacterium]
MKKGIKIGIGIILAVALLVAVGFVTKVGGAEITEGTYKIKDCPEYPDAYLVVEDGKLQFFNIDFNAIYQEAQLELYKTMEERGAVVPLTKEQLEQVSDLNQMYVVNEYELLEEGSKTGTFTYVYWCYQSGYAFGLVFEYDSLHKTVQINNPVKTLVFEK